MQNNKLIQLILLIVGTAGTVLVGFGILTAGQNDQIQAFLPELVGVIMQGIAIFQSFKLADQNEAEAFRVRQELEIRDVQVQQLKQEVESLKHN